MIRPFRLRDSITLHRLSRRCTPLQIERHLTQPLAPLWAAMGAPLPWYGSGAATYLFHPSRSERSLPPGFVQALKHLGRPEADVMSIAPHYDQHGETGAVWQRMLQYLVREAGEHGIQRLYIQIASDAPGYEAICESGFTPYIRETLYQQPSPAPLPQSSVDTSIRRQVESDSFALQRLHYLFTPPIVQKAEGMFISNGESNTPLTLQQWWQPGHIEGFVYEQGGEILAAAHVRRGGKGHWLRLYGDPENAMIIAAVLAHTLTSLSHHQPLPVYCALRPYQNRIGAILRDYHFQSGPEITRFVKHTTSFAKRPVTTQTREALDSVPGLIPTESRLPQYHRKHQPLDTI